MRAVPHRVVCLLGLDDGVFPRRVVPDGDDLTADDARVGDPDPRGEDRQLLLDALTSATETLVVLYTGTDPRNGERAPPGRPGRRPARHPRPDRGDRPASSRPAGG